MTPRRPPAQPPPARLAAAGGPQLIERGGLGNRGPLTADAAGYRLGGTTGPQGQLAMRAAAPSIGSQPIELNVSGPG